MTLKSSEIKNFLSWRVSTALKSLIVASASCHIALPHFVRPMLRVLKFVLKIIFQSPELDRSIFFSRWFSVSKKSVYSFCHWVRLIELSSWFNINPCYFKSMYSPWRWASSWRSSWFCFSLGSACKRKYVFVVEVSWSLSSYSLSSKSVTNLFRPWEILTHEWELSLFTDSNLISTPCLPCR